MRRIIKLKLTPAFGLVILMLNGAATLGGASMAVAAQQAQVRDFALDLAQGGPDADDANFRDYA